MATMKKNKPKAPTKTPTKSSGSVLPLGGKQGNPGNKMDWKKRRQAMDAMIDGKRR